MQPFPSYAGPSKKTLIIAAVLTVLSLALWAHLTPEVDVLSDPLTRSGSGTQTWLHHVKKPVASISRKVPKAPESVLYPFTWILGNLSSFSEQLSTLAANWDTPYQYIFSKPSKRAFLPPAFYETDRHGAIEVFEKHGMTVCRIYKVCRHQDGALQAPLWMRNHSSLLKRCGLPSVQFKPTWTLKSRFGIPPYYDWLGPDLPTYTLLKFTKTPLSYFFAHRSAKRSILEDNSSRNKVKRTCVSPFAGNDVRRFSRICGSKPEGRVSNPAFLVNMKANAANADNEFQDALTAEFFKVHGVEADVFEPTSALLKKPKACFRSVIMAPGIARQTSKNKVPSNGRKGNPITSPSWTISNADNVIKKELAKDANKVTQQKKEMRPSQSPTTKQFSNITGEARRANSEHRNASMHKRSLLETSNHADVFNIEGGVEMITHREVDAKRWNNSKGFDDPIKHAYGVCRIYRACRRPDRTIVLPNWVKKYQRDLETHCGLGAVSYVSDDEFAAAYERLTKPTNQRNGRTLSSLLEHPNREIKLDLMGTRVYRAQEHHFMTDFFHDGIHAFDALFNQPRGRHSIFKRRCIYMPSSQVGREIQERRDCVNVRTYTDKLNPALLLHDRATQRNPSSKYINEVLAMMPLDGKSGPKVIFSPHLSSSGPQESTCFRSIVLTRNSYPPKLVLQEKDRNVFFAKNNISRISIHDEPKYSTAADNDCHVRLTILMPRKSSTRKKGAKKKSLASRMQSWEIENKEDIVSKVQQLTQRLSKNITVDIQTFSHDGKTASDARKIMQQTEIVLSVNNPTMTSIAFARPHTSVVELQPFGYSTGPYRSFASSLHLTYHRVTAAPDEERFANCVRENYHRGWEDGVDLKSMEEAKEGLLQLFHKASKKYDLSELDISKQTDKEGRIRTARIPLERICVRTQRIRVDAKHVAELIVRDAEAYCDKRRKMPLMLSLSGKDI